MRCSRFGALRAVHRRVLSSMQCTLFPHAPPQAITPLSGFPNPYPRLRAYHLYLHLRCISFGVLPWLLRFCTVSNAHPPSLLPPSASRLRWTSTRYLASATLSHAHSSHCAALPSSHVALSQTHTLTHPLPPPGRAGSQCTALIALRAVSQTLTLPPSCHPSFKAELDLNALPWARSGSAVSGTAVRHTAPLKADLLLNALHHKHTLPDPLRAQ